MSHNPIENYFLAEAIKALKPQYEEVYGEYPNHFYLNKGGPRFMVLRDGPDAGKLTVATSLDGRLVPDPRIQPVDCYNLISPKESIAAAVMRVISNKQSPTQHPSTA